jgi:hypothetical protein
LQQAEEQSMKNGSTISSFDATPSPFGPIMRSKGSAMSATSSVPD